MVGDVVLAVACVNFFVCFVVVCDGYICSVILLLVMEFDFSPVFVLCSATKLPIEENYKRKTLNRKQGETLEEHRKCPKKHCVKHRETLEEMGGST